MGLFESIFGIDKKENIGALIPNPPQFNLAEGSDVQFQQGIQSLIDTFQRRSTGQDQFDFIKFLFEPQLTRLNQAFGIGSRGTGELGPLGRRQGALGRLEADLQRRGLFDTGTSAVLQAQLESERAAKEAELFGQAKQLQRADIDASLQSLANLFPTRFQAQNIQPQIDFFNAQNRFNAELARNNTTLSQRQRRAGQKSNAILGGIGIGLAPFTGGLSLSNPFSNRSSSNISSGSANLFSSITRPPLASAFGQNLFPGIAPSTNRFQSIPGLQNLFF